MVFLDDVCSATMLNVNELILNSRAAFIITTRSSAVTSFLQSSPPSPLVVTLDVFSEKENCELVNAKTESKVSEEELALSTRYAQRVFGNLPLCVSIYTSLQAVCSRRPENAAFHRLCDEALSFNKWKDVEREFGDRFHVRGLTGILEVAEKKINSKPLVLSLFAKVSLCLPERVLWQVLVLNDG